MSERFGPYEILGYEYDHPVLLWQGKPWTTPTGFVPGLLADDGGYVRLVTVDPAHGGRGEVPALLRGLWAWPGDVPGPGRSGNEEGFHLNLDVAAPGRYRVGQGGIRLDEATARALSVSLDAWLRRKADAR